MGFFVPRLKPSVLADLSVSLYSIWLYAYSYWLLAIRDSIAIVQQSPNVTEGYQPDGLLALPSGIGINYDYS